MGQVIEAGAVERYLACLAVHDWDGLAAAVVDDDLIREGAYCDVELSETIDIDGVPLVICEFASHSRRRGSGS
jgi:hypothetical protein